MYLDSSKCAGAKTSDEAIALVKKLQTAYEKDVAAGAKWSGSYSASSSEGKAELEKFKNVGDVELQYHRFWHMGDAMMALGVMAELYPDMPAGKNPTPTEATEGTTEATTEATKATEATKESTSAERTMWGDANVDKTVDLMDIIVVNKYLLGLTKLDGVGEKNADINDNGKVESNDGLNVMKLAFEILKQSDCPVKK